MSMAKVLLVMVSAVLSAVLSILPALAQPDPPCGSWKDRPPAPSKGEEDAGLAKTPETPPDEPRRPAQDGTGTQDPDKRIK
jgi:hypothetical protein